MEAAADALAALAPTWSAAVVLLSYLGYLAAAGALLHGKLVVGVVLPGKLVAGAILPGELVAEGGAASSWTVAVRRARGRVTAWRRRGGRERNGGAASTAWRRRVGEIATMTETRGRNPIAEKRGRKWKIILRDLLHKFTSVDKLSN